MIRLRILNPELTDEPCKSGPMWSRRYKLYDYDLTMDEDIKKSPIGHRIDGIELDNINLTTKSSVQDYIDLLNNVKDNMVR